MNVHRNLTSRQVARYGRKCFFNAIELLSDAVVIFDHKRFGTAYFMSTIAIEEIGKFLIANDVLFNHQINEANIERTIEWIRVSFNHKRKQSEFISNTLLKLPIDFLKLVADEKLDRKKQQSLYVDICLNKAKGFLRNCDKLI